MEDLLRVFAALDDEDTVYTLLEDLFTIREIRRRRSGWPWRASSMPGKSYAAIEGTGASATTITRVSKCLSCGSGGYNAALNALDDVRAASQRDRPSPCGGRGVVIRERGGAACRGRREQRHRDRRSCTIVLRSRVPQVDGARLAAAGATSARPVCS